jgi:hypothetical protein
VSAPHSGETMQPICLARGRSESIADRTGDFDAKTLVSASGR